mgnify:CR=1 FL=1
MAYTTINKSSAHFNTKLYTGNGSTQTISSVGFQPDWTWTKHRDGATAHMLFDAVRGALKRLQSNSSNSESTAANTLTSWNSDGFALGTENDTNGSGRLFTSWNWKAGTTSGLSGGTINPSSYSINSTSGFGIYKYTGTGSAGTIPSGLPSVKCFIIKALDASSNGWVFYHQDLGTNKYLQLDEDSTPYTGTSQFNNTAPTTSTTNSLISVGTAGSSNNNGRDYIMYAFSELQGYSKFGSYTGNGNANGTFVYTGFKPAFVMTKKTSGTSSWDIHDTKRDTFNVATKYLLAEDSGAEGSTVVLDILSNGFKFRTSNGDRNASGATYIYMAFGQSLVGTNNVPCTAR